MPSPGLTLTVLGAGDAFATGGRPYSSYLLEPAAPPSGETGARAALLDCGPTSVPMLMAMGFDMARLDLLLLSHLHGDHFAGVSALYLDYQFRTRRERPLTVAGPPGTREKCEALFRLCYRETVEMMDRRFEVDYRELPEGESEIGGLRLLARRVVHQHVEVPYGYRIEWAGRALGWSGDTQWDEVLLDLARGTDLFLVECFTAGQRRKFHLSLEDIEREAPRLDTKRILLTHLGESALARQAAEGLPFDAARDGERVAI